MTDRNYDMNDTEDEGIDIVDMAKRLWAERRMIFKWAGIAVVVAFRKWAVSEVLPLWPESISAMAEARMPCIRICIRIS